MADDIRVKFTADGSSYNKQLKELTQQNKTLKSEVDKVKSSTDENTTAQEKAAKVAEAVQKQVKGQEEYIKALKAEYEKLSQSEDTNSTELMKQEERINKAETALNKMNDELVQAQNEADGYGSEAGEAADQTAKMDEAARLLAASKLAEFYDQVSEAVQKVAEGAYNAAKELDEGYDTIIKKTGATGDALANLQESADAVYGSMPAEMADVGTAIGEVNTRFGLTGDALEGTSKLFLEFAEITDTDVNSAIGTTSRLLKTYGGDVKDADKLLGYFAKQSQDTGVDTTALMNSLDQNGATLREMGLGLQESTKLLATFEANGVDSSGAMTGLRKAVINGAKAGKSFDQVLAEASDQIKNASSDTEALQIATELFGTKGAVVMADGIRSGRISLDDLTESMDTYGDVVGDTFEATLDPWDKATVAMNNLKIAGKELAGEALETIAPLLEKVVEGAQGAVKWFKDLPEPVKKVVAVVGMLAAGAGVAFPKVQSLFQTLSMFKAANAIKGLTGVSEAAEGVGGGFTKAGGGLALFSNPLALAITGISAAGLALVGLAANTQAQIEAEYGLTDAQRAQIDAINDEAAAYGEMVAARQQAVDGTLAEFSHIEELAKEYDTLTDANGRVKKGYEDRANFILNEMAAATGKTIEDIQSEITANGSLVASIQDVINQKKAEALLSVYQTDYAEAVKNSAAAYDTYNAAIQTAAESQAAYDQLIRDTSGMQAQRTAWEQQLATMDQSSAEYITLAQQLADLQSNLVEQDLAIQTAKAALDESNAAVDTARTTYEGYQNTILAYEGASAAVISGDAEKIQSALTHLSGDYSDAQLQQKAELESMVRAAESNLELVEKAFRNKKVSQAAYTAAKEAVTKAKAELDKFYGIGQGAADGLDKGMKSRRGILITTGTDLGKSTVNAVATGAETNSPSRATQRTGGDIDQGLIQGMNAGKATVTTTGQGIGKAATDGIGSTPLETVRQKGLTMSNTFAGGIDSGKTGAKTAGSTVAGEAATGLQSKNSSTKGYGAEATQKFNAGIESEKSKTEGAAGIIADKTANMKRDVLLATGWGAEMVKNFADGMNNAAWRVSEAAKSVANNASNYLKHTTPKMGPLSDDDVWGVHFLENITDGMNNAAAMRSLEMASLRAAEAMAMPTLTFGAEGINGNMVSNSLTYGDIVVNVTGANVQNEDALAQKISQQIFRQVKAERGAFA